MRQLFSMLPAHIQVFLRHARNVVRAVPYHGKEKFCPVCGKSSQRFRQYGTVPNAQCAHCGSLERHRLLWIYLTTKTNLFEGTVKRMLHVAPEPCFEPRLKHRLGDSYLTADISDPRAMLKMDIMDIKYPHGFFDVIYCCHVLEHVQDDRTAIREFYRVLKNDGWAILLVPITADKTFEDPSIVEPDERLKAFGQEDHVRRYGTDYGDRLREAGFNVEVSTVGDLIPRDEDAIRMGLTSETGEIYYCTKQRVTSQKCRRQGSTAHGGRGDRVDLRGNRPQLANGRR